LVTPSLYKYKFIRWFSGDAGEVCGDDYDGGKYVDGCTFSCGGGATSINACCKRHGYTEGCCSGTGSNGAGDAYCT